MRTSFNALMLAVSTALVTLIATSCTTPSAPIVTTSSDNDLHGFVELWDSCGGQEADLQGVVVTATSANWSGSDTTGKDGTWTIADAPAGVYIIDASRGAFVAHPITNVQYVGSGKYDVRKVWLSAPMPSDFVSSARVDSSYWHFETQELENGVVRHFDSVYTIDISVDTKCAMSGSLDYRIVESPDADCDSAIVSTIYGEPTPNGTTQIVWLGSAYKKLVDRYGSSLWGKHLYLQIRPTKYGKRADGTVGCLQPVVVDLFY